MLAYRQIINYLSRHIFSVFSSCLLLEILAEEASDLLCRTLVPTGCHELPVAGLRALRLDHLRLPRLFEGIPVGLAHVVQNAACEDHGGNHVQAAVVPLAQALPARPQPQKRLFWYTQRFSETVVKEPLWFCHLGFLPPTALLFGIDLHQPALERVTRLSQYHVPMPNSWVSVINKHIVKARVPFNEH